MLGLVSRHLKGMGFHVVQASEGDAAWELAQKHGPDLVVLDVMMPGMSGWEVCKRIKSPNHDDAFNATGVIMLTGIGENLNDMTSPLFAADTWLNKPFDFADLEDRIRETLAKYGTIAPPGLRPDRRPGRWRRGRRGRRPGRPPRRRRRPGRRRPGRPPRRRPPPR